MHIVRAEKEDDVALTELTIRSKDYWNYGKEQIEIWHEELTIKGIDIKKNAVFKGILGHQIVGYYAYTFEMSGLVRLTHLFLDPVFIGQGYGKLLLLDPIARISKSSAQRIVVDADPHAEGFYRQYGFKTVGQLQSSIKDRFLPIMQLIV